MNERCPIHGPTSSDLRDRLAVKIENLLQGLPGGLARAQTNDVWVVADGALSVLLRDIEIVAPHREGCEGKWVRWKTRDLAEGWRFFRCSHPFIGDASGSLECRAESRIPEALLVSLVEAKEGA